MKVRLAVYREYTEDFQQIEGDLWMLDEFGSEWAEAVHKGDIIRVPSWLMRMPAGVSELALVVVRKEVHFRPSIPKLVVLTIIAAMTDNSRALMRSAGEAE